MAEAKDERTENGEQGAENEHAGVDLNQTAKSAAQGAAAGAVAGAAAMAAREAMKARGGNGESDQPSDDEESSS